MVVQESSPIAIPTTHRPALAAFAAAIGAGITSAVLVPYGSLGIGFGITVTMLYAFSRWLTKHTASKPHPTANWLWLPIVLFSLLIGWRDSGELRFINLLMVMIFTGILAIRARPCSIAKGSVYDYPFRATGAWFVALIDAIPLLANDIAWRAIPRNVHGKQAAGVVRGILIATPILLIFGGLFASADPTFARLFQGFTIDAPTWIQQGFVGMGFAWIAAGFFRRIYVTHTPDEVPPKALEQRFRLGVTELAVILGSINLLFALFVATQAQHFFGGLEVVHSTNGLSFAEFARRGFFELVAASALVLPTLLSLNAVADPESRRFKILYKGLSICLIGLLSVVMLSASWKLKLYMEAYSLSTLRLYVAAALGWMATVYAWFAATTLRERSNRFAWGGVVLLALFSLGLNIVNPDRLTAAWNVSTGRQVDWHYIVSLSDDASPVIQSVWQRMPQDAKDSWSTRQPARLDWRAANLSQLLSRAATNPQQLR